MLVDRNTLGPVLSRRSPSQKDNTISSHFDNSINDLLHQSLPALARMGIRLASTDSQASVDEQDTTIRPWGQQATLVWRRLVVRVLFLETLIDVLERWGSGVWRTDGEAETVSLVWSVIGVLAYDNCFYSVEGRMS